MNAPTLAPVGSWPLEALETQGPRRRPQRPQAPRPGPERSGPSRSPRANCPLPSCGGPCPRTTRTILVSLTGPALQRQQLRGGEGRGFLRLLFCFRRAQGGPGGKEHKEGTRMHSGIAARADSGCESRLHDRELQVRRDPESLRGNEARHGGEGGLRSERGKVDWGSAPQGGGQLCQLGKARNLLTKPQQDLSVERGGEAEVNRGRRL